MWKISNNFMLDNATSFSLPKLKVNFQCQSVVASSLLFNHLPREMSKYSPLPRPRHAWCAWSLFCSFMLELRREKTSLWKYSRYGMLGRCSSSITLMCSHTGGTKKIIMRSFSTQNYFKLFILGWHGQLFATVALEIW
jgi:hypothetical protein